MHLPISAEDIASVYVYVYLHTYTYTLVTSSAEMFGRCILRQDQSFDFDLLGSFRKLVMVNECAHIVKDSNV